MTVSPRCMILDSFRQLSRRSASAGSWQALCSGANGGMISALAIPIASLRRDTSDGRYLAGSVPPAFFSASNSSTTVRFQYRSNRTPCAMSARMRFDFRRRPFPFARPPTSPAKRRRSLRRSSAWSWPRRGCRSLACWRRAAGAASRCRGFRDPARWPWPPVRRRPARRLRQSSMRRPWRASRHPPGRSRPAPHRLATFGTLSAAVARADSERRMHAHQREGLQASHDHGRCTWRFFQRDLWRAPAAVKPAVMASRMASSTEMSSGCMRSRGR